ncbi:unnamed protein product [Owenia fusiformis]|uniref:Tetraspanin n=1 Tax=Owenia fusiformis TaxID=6347 RepID=A0A8S4PLA8_OWEFU|nr:unnamed protein product [Owenia fusiformis]
MARRRRDTSEVSCVIKYLVFGFNVVFWLIGGAVAAVGIWAWSEKEMFQNIGKITSIPVDPALIFIIVGGIMFLIGFTGCVGALRENTCLLLIFCVSVGIIFFAQLAVGILGFIYRDWFKTQIETQMQTIIVQYRDDPDLQNLIDWVQDSWLKCCGVTGPQDWESNIYFNCSSPSREKCGVPFSCCQPVDGGEGIVNRQCGYDTRDPDLKTLKASALVYNKGCIEAGEAWLQANLIPVAGVAVGIALLQILGICFAQNLRSDILAQKSKWR